MIIDNFLLKVTKSFTLPEERNSLCGRDIKNPAVVKRDSYDRNFLELSHLDGNYGALVALVA